MDNDLHRRKSLSPTGTIEFTDNYLHLHQGIFSKKKIGTFRWECKFFIFVETSETSAEIARISVRYPESADGDILLMNFHHAENPKWTRPKFGWRSNSWNLHKCWGVWRNGIQLNRKCCEKLLLQSNTNNLESTQECIPVKQKKKNQVLRTSPMYNESSPWTQESIRSLQFFHHLPE